MHRRRPTDIWRIRSPRGGFTLLEVALAVLVLGTALVALTRMLALGRLGADADAKRVVALSILREQAELAKARGFSGIESQAATTLDAHPGYTYSVSWLAMGSRLKVVTITVNWASPTGAAASDSVTFVAGQSVLPVRTWEVR